jgi:hypothetical protein
MARDNSFGYPRQVFYLRTLVGAMATLTALALTLLQSLAPFYSALVVLLPLTYGLIYGVSPLFTHHSIREGRLHLRQGVYFRASIPLEDVAAVREVSDARRPGVGWDRKRRAVQVTSSRLGVLELRLKRPLRFPYVLGRRSGRVLLNVDNPGGFIRALGMEGK